jgi:hypothetical protein
MAKNIKTKVNYGVLLCKLKIELIHNVTSKPKKPKVEKTYQPTKTQQNLLDVCRFKDFKTPSIFKYVPEVNEFVTKYVDKKTTFLQKHGAFPCPCQFKVLHQLLLEYLM